MAAEAVGNLYATLGLNTGGFDSGITAAQKKLGEFGKIRVGEGLKAGFGEVENALAGLAGGAGAAGSILSGLGITGVAAAAAIGVAFQGARQAMAFGDEIGDTAAKLSVTTDYLQEMRYAAHGLGGDFNDADAALESFTKTFGLATSGLSSRSLKPFEALGLDPKDFASVEEALNATIDKISALGSAAEQAAVADKLGLTPLLPAIREGSAAIDNMREEARRLGFVMDADLIEKAGKANDEYEALSRILDVEFKSVMAKAIPLVIELTRMMVSGARAAGDFAAGLSKALGVGRDPAEMARQGIAQADAMLKRDPNNTVAKANRAKFQAQLDREYKDYAAAMDRQRAAAMAGTAAGGSLADPSAASDAKAAADRRAAEASRAAQAAERERLAGLQALANAMRQAEEDSARYAGSLLEEIATMGMSSEQLRRREIDMAAAAAPTEALANQIRALGDQYIALAKVGSEWGDIQKLIKGQQDDSIKTFQEATGGIFEFTTALESAAYDLDEAARMSRELAWDIDDIARAINDNDWTSAFAGLANVLAKVEKAFANAKDAKDKYAAVAMLAQGVGGAVGGTGGAVVGGAGSGALAGLGVAGSLTTLGLASGPIGWAALGIGAVLGGLGGLFGSSKAKKQAKAQAAAEAAAKEAQRQQQIADTRLALEIELLRAQGKEQEAVNLERKAELDALAKLDASLVAQRQALYDAIDANTAKAAADEAAAQAAERAATVAAKAQSIQDRIDALTMTDAELLAKARARERAELVALAPELATMIDQLFGLEDATTAAAEATAEATAVAEAAARNRELYAKVEIDAINAVADAAERQRQAMNSLGDSFVSAMQNAEEAEKSLRAFADSLLSELGLGGQQQSYAAMKTALQLNAKNGNFDQSLAQAFLEASKATQSTAAGYQSDVAWVRGLALTKANDLADYPNRLAMLFRSIQADASGLPGFASGGSIVVGGNTGLDQNLLSLNNVPVARVNYGETLSVTPAGGANDNGMVAELRALRGEMAELRRNSLQTVLNTSKTARQLERWDIEGQPTERPY